LNDVWNLRTVEWLRELPGEEVERLRRASRHRDYDRGATIFTPESHPHSVYLLESGLARIYRLSKQGAETTFGYVAPGEVFGELTLFGDFPRESFAHAVRRSRVWKVPRESFQQLIVRRPSIAMEVTRQIGERLKRIENRVEDLVFRDVRSRVAHILIELARDFGRGQGGEVLLELELTQSELATLVGSTRQTVNASLRELEQQGLVRRDGRRLRLVEPAELERVARTTAAG
jgi:CRP-like cAMP-binding protein